MSVAFYMDEHVPRAVSTGLRLRGIDVITAQEDGAEGHSDPQLLDRATALSRVLFTQDEDLLHEGCRRQREGVAFAGIAFAHQQNATIGRLVRDLELLGKVGEPADLASRIEYLPL